MHISQVHLFIFIVAVALAGLYFYAMYGTPKLLEGLSNATPSSSRCPNILLQKGTRFYLYNSNLAKVPGVNPVEFENLEDYVEFLDWQRSQGIRCPVLYLQHSYDAQGSSSYKVRPSVTEPQGGLPPSYPNPTLLVDATRNDQPYNQGTAPGYDASSYYVGTTTPLDEMNQQQENLLYSPDPMDANWGGEKYTQSLVDSGYYAGNEVSLAIS